MILFEAAPPVEMSQWPDHPTLLTKPTFLKSVVHELLAPEQPVEGGGVSIRRVCVCAYVCTCIHVRERQGSLYFGLVCLDFVFC